VAGVVQVAHGLKAGLHLFQQRLVLIVEFARLRHLAIKALVGERQHAVGHALRPHVATSSLLFRSTKSSQENSVSRVSGAVAVR
jgi:hypothetical protein